jgi:predicted GTPase
VTLVDEVRPLVERAVATYAGTAQEAPLRAVLERLDAPLRVAIAGKVKAGKSTLLNALVGERLAPTDEGECTRIVTWYQDGITYRVTLDPHQGEPRQVPFTRDEGAIDVDLQGESAEAVERLVVEWPTASLKRMTLIDTPGIASLSADVSARTEAFLTPEDEKATEADAVLYLMKHLHSSDVGFLEAFHDEETSQATPVNAIAVLSRADEVGVGRLDSMESARTIATRYREDPKVRKLAQTVVAVAGLLAETGGTLREAEFAALRTLAATPEEDLEKLLLSADRFVSAPTNVGLTELEREALLGRFGVFGIRLAVHLIRGGEVTTATGLADALLARSGLDELQAALLSQFADRRDVLVARTALVAIEAAVRDHPVEGGDALTADIERLVAGAHEFDELRLLNALRTGAVTAKPDDIEAMERLLGTEGGTVEARLGLPGGADRAQVAAAAQETMARWQRRAESPMSSPQLVDAARVLVRSCEQILVDLSHA